VNYKFKQDGEVAVVAFSGNITGGPDADAFHAEIKSLIEKGGRKFLFDFSKAKWINSTGLGIVVAAYMSVTGAEGRLVLCGSNERIEGVFYISRLEKILDVRDSYEEGMAALA